MEWRALFVEVIRRLWDRGLYRDNPWLQKIHDNYFDIWTTWRAALTMESVDQQAKDLTPEPEVAKPIYWEETEGKTPLGGPLGYTYEFYDNDA